MLQSSLLLISEECAVPSTCTDMISGTLLPCERTNQNKKQKCNFQHHIQKERVLPGCLSVIWIGHVRNRIKALTPHATSPATLGKHKQKECKASLMMVL